MPSMKSIAVISLLMLSLIFAFSTVLHVTAQPNLEEQLKLAKEKVAQIKPAHTISNTTMDLLSNRSLLNRLSN
jgi:hypothetical protein